MGERAGELAGSDYAEREQCGTDPARFTQWAADLATGQAEPRRIAMLEIEARIRRLAVVALGDPVRPDAGDDPTLRQVVSMVRHIAAHFREPITIAEIAAAAIVHPTYAVPQFRKVVRSTIGDYLKLHRLAEARRLLATTDLRREPSGRSVRIRVTQPVLPRLH
jgi:AraC-like DNA-binding protein